MYLKKINILNYRNIEESELVFSPKINLFWGNNGMGKTNLLDSILFEFLQESSQCHRQSIDTSRYGFFHYTGRICFSRQYRHSVVFGETVTKETVSVQQKRVRTSGRPYRQNTSRISLAIRLFAHKRRQRRATAVYGYYNIAIQPRVPRQPYFVQFGSEIA